MPTAGPASTLAVSITSRSASGPFDIGGEGSRGRRWGLLIVPCPGLDRLRFAPSDQIQPCSGSPPCRFAPRGFFLPFARALLGSGQEKALPLRGRASIIKCPGLD